VIASGATLAILAWPVTTTHLIKIACALTAVVVQLIFRKLVSPVWFDPKEIFFPSKGKGKNFRSH
jgi:hypothetical protein